MTPKSLPPRAQPASTSCCSRWGLLQSASCCRWGPSAVLIGMVAAISIVYTNSHLLNEGTVRHGHLQIFLVLLVATAINFTLCVHVDPGYVDLVVDESREEQKKPNVNVNQGVVQFENICRHCHVKKPVGAHHCRTCNRCVRRMDHHCPWMNNCIGDKNYKFFFLTILYGSILGWFVTVSLTEEIWRDVILARNADSSTLFLFGRSAFTANAEKYFLVGAFLTVSAMTMGVTGLLGFHIYIGLYLGTTTIDFCDREQRRRKANFHVKPKHGEGIYKVFGKSPWLWFLPFVDPEDVSSLSSDIQETEYEETCKLIP